MLDLDDAAIYRRAVERLAAVNHQLVLEVARLKAANERLWRLITDAGEGSVGGPEWEKTHAN